MKTMSIELLDETFQLIEEIAKSNDWSHEDTLRAVVSSGIASYRTEEKARNLDGLSDSEKVKKLLRWLVDADSDYALLKFQNFYLLRDNKTIELNLVGCRSENESLKKFAQKLRGEIARLKAELGDRKENK